MHQTVEESRAGQPTGRSYHACFGPADKLMVFDVWTSQAAFDKFGKTLVPILQGLGVDPGQPSVMPIHKIIVPPAMTAAAKRAAPRKTARAGRKKR